MSKFYDFEAEDVMCNMHKMEEYQEQGFEILDFPCNQFGNQVILCYSLKQTCHLRLLPQPA